MDGRPRKELGRPADRKRVKWILILVPVPGIDPGSATKDQRRPLPHAVRAGRRRQGRSACIERFNGIRRTGILDAQLFEDPDQVPEAAGTRPQRCNHEGPPESLASQRASIAGSESGKALLMPEMGRSPASRCESHHSPNPASRRRTGITLPRWAMFSPVRRQPEVDTDAVLLPLHGVQGMADIEAVAQP